MATTKHTITLDEAQLARVKKLAASGKADSAGWGAMLGLALKQTGGPLTARERAWADSVLRARPKAKRRRAG